MPRPVKKRNVKSYTRDIESLGRLRTALIVDNNADWTTCQDAILQIDKLVSSLRKLANATIEKSA